MRRRPPLAFAGLLIMTLVSILGFTAFSPEPGTTTPTLNASVPLPVPAGASGRVAAAILATELGPPPPPTTTTTTTTTTAPTKAAPEAQSRSTSPPRTTTTTRSKPPTTTTTTSTTRPPTTTTEPPVEGGVRDVEEWRPLVEQYFSGAQVESALSVIECESNGDPLAVNAISGASGLFQFIPGTWAWASSLAAWDGADALVPEPNVAVAGWLVQDSLDRGADPWLHWTCKP